MVAMEHGLVTQRAIVLLLSLLGFMNLPNKRLGGPGIAKVCGFRCCPSVLNREWWNAYKNFTTSFTSLVLLPAIQKSLLSLDTILKLFYFANLGNNSIQYYYIINLNALNNTGKLSPYLCHVKISKISLNLTKTTIDNHLLVLQPMVTVSGDC